MARYVLVDGLVIKPLDDCRVIFDPGTGDTHFVPSEMAPVIDSLQRGSLVCSPETAGSPIEGPRGWAKSAGLEQFLTDAVQAGILQQS